MAYKANTSILTRKVTLCSAGSYSGPIYNPTFALAQALIIDNRLLHIVGVELVSFAHPTYFHHSCMHGQIKISPHIGNDPEVQELDATLFNS